MRAPEPLPDPELDDALVRQISSLVNTPIKQHQPAPAWLPSG